jgi:DNA-binding CsgD family transcriptional regulator
MVGAINAFWLTHNTLPARATSKAAFHDGFTLVGSHRALLPGKDAATAKGAPDGNRNGNTLFRPLSVDPLLDPLRHRGFQNEATVRPSLTKRHTEVLQMIANGYSSRRIAHVLSVSIKTVEKHRQAVMDRLDIHEIANLTRYAVSSGLVESKPYAQLRDRALGHSEKPLRRSAAHQIERACLKTE